MPESATNYPSPAVSESSIPGVRPKVLVSGSSGMIGTALVRSWNQDQIQIVRLVRHPEDASAENAPGDAVLWEPGANPAIPNPEQLSGVVAAVHLSGANVAAGRWTEKHKLEIVSSRVRSTTALAEALSRLNPLPRVLVCASATGIYGDRGDEVLTEESRPGDGFLAGTCVAWESATRAAEDAGIRVVHLRFGVVLSPRAVRWRSCCRFFVSGSVETSATAARGCRGSPCATPLEF